MLARASASGGLRPPSRVETVLRARVTFRARLSFSPRAPARSELSALHRHRQRLRLDSIAPRIAAEVAFRTSARPAKRSAHRVDHRGGWAAIETPELQRRITQV